MLQSFGGTLPQELAASLRLLDSQGKLPATIANEAIELSSIEPGGCDDGEISVRIERLTQEVNNLLA